MLCRSATARFEDDADGPYILRRRACAGRCMDCAKVSGFRLSPTAAALLRRRAGGRQGAPRLRGRGVARGHPHGRRDRAGRDARSPARRGSTDPALRQLFARFALMENEHGDAVAPLSPRRCRRPRPGFASRAGGDLRRRGRDRPQDPANLFRIAIALEHAPRAATIAQHAGQCAPGSAEQLLYRELAPPKERGTPTLWDPEYARWHAGKPGLFASDLPGAAPESPATERFNAAQLLLAARARGHTRARLRRRTADLRPTARPRRRAASAWQARGIARGDRVTRSSSRRRHRLGRRLPRHDLGRRRRRRRQPQGPRPSSGTTSSTRPGSRRSSAAGATPTRPRPGANAASRSQTGGVPSTPRHPAPRAVEAGDSLLVPLVGHLGQARRWSTATASRAAIGGLARRASACAATTGSTPAPSSSSPIRRPTACSPASSSARP